MQLWLRILLACGLLGIIIALFRAVTQMIAVVGTDRLIPLKFWGFLAVIGICIFFIAKILT